MMPDTRITEAALAWHRAGHGAKTAVVASLAAELGVSVVTAYKRIQSVTVSRPRKRRVDAGCTGLKRDEAELIWALIHETTRRTGAGALPLMEAVEQLRSAGLIEAAHVDPDTGEWRPLSESAIRRAMQQHGYGFAEMLAETPAARLSSPHPNWCWQLDASVSTQFYLAASGTEQMDRAVHYDGKPGNLIKIADQRIWRYAITDHCSGAIEVFYAQGAESAANAVSALIHAMTGRTDGTMYGVPKYLMTDPGSGMTAAAMANFLKPLGVTHLAHAVGSARVTGQVENAHNLIERYFESTLKLRSPVTSIAEINAMAQQWARAFNATRTHSRTGMTRRDGWLRITPEQLVLAPSVDVLRQLPNSTPKPCRIKDGLIRFGGEFYEVRDLPGGAVNGRTLDVVRNALDDNAVRVLLKGDDGLEAYFIAPRIARDAFGFLSTAAQIGTEFRAARETPADARRTAIERLAMDAASAEDAAAKRKAKRVPFGNRIDPTAPWRAANVPEALPRSATPNSVLAPAQIQGEPLIPRIAPQYVAPLLSHPEMARGIKWRLEARGAAWSTDMYARMASLWPDGATEEALDDCAVQLMRGGLRAVGGVA